MVSFCFYYYFGGFFHSDPIFNFFLLLRYAVLLTHKDRENDFSSSLS